MVVLRSIFALGVVLLVFGRAQAQAPSCVAFVHVSVIPMDRNEVLPDQSVLVRDGRIVAVDLFAQTPLPNECDRIDGRDRYLMPGLVDSHVHFPLTDRADQLLVLQMLLANGITTGINMEGSPQILELRNEIRSGRLFAQTLYTTGVFIQQPAFTTAEQVAKEVVAEQEAGYDFIKVHGQLTKEAYDKLFDTAKKLHIRVVGHVPSNLGIHAALGRQILIVHSEEFLYPISNFIASYQLTRPRLIGW
jgi:cytosine/adenosine deaminase-related metal-dependent hydrolase